MCDNLYPTARNLLILKRRDVRVVEGARLENDSGDAASSDTETSLHTIDSTTSRHRILLNVNP